MLFGSQPDQVSMRLLQLHAAASVPYKHSKFRLRVFTCIQIHHARCRFHTCIQSETRGALQMIVLSDVSLV